MIVRGLYDWPKCVDDDFCERLDHYSKRNGRPPSREGGNRPPSREGNRPPTRPPSREGGRKSRQQKEAPRVEECGWVDDEPQEILLEDCIRDGGVLDRAMMIEAASRKLLRQRGDISGTTSSRVGTPSSLRRKDHDRENELFGGEKTSEDYKTMKRPPSRKKNPSQSAVAGLGAFASASPVLVTNAFEKPKSIRPPFDSMHNRRPPSRHKEPTKSLHLEGEPKEIVNGRTSETDGRWACARSTDRAEAKKGPPEAPPVPAVLIPWQAATLDKEPLEINGTGFNSRPASQLGQHVGGLWPSGPRMQVEDVDDVDSGLKSMAHKPTKLESRQQKCRVPFDTSLGPDFLNLFAT